ncbi:MAG: alanine racemase [Proteobacteria bacterium]|nr:alanine racemase [Pseudomonadota bacterium]
MARPTSATIHIDALRHNLARVRTLAPRSRVMAVVKADGYGHGLERVVRALAGADAFGVAAFADAERIRAAGLSNRIVLLSGLDDPADLPLLRGLDVDIVIHHDSQLALLEADPARTPVRVWLKLDTGMHRLGFPPARAAELRARLQALPQVREVLLMSHFASSDDFDGAQTPAQIAAFDAVDGMAGEACSLANSAAVLGWPSAHRDWVRAGGALYGLSVVPGKTGADFGLQAAMTLATRLIAINRTAKGESIGYSATWTCPEDMDVGVAAIGYGDGYPRSVPSGTPVVLRRAHGGDVRVPIVGRVSMDLMTLDLRNAPDARVGDPVVLWGPQLPVEEIAAAAGTIAYDLTCSITRRVRFFEA